MDLFEMLRADHTEVKNLLEKLKDTSQRADKSRRNGLEKLHQLLIPHMKSEEEIYYPELIDVGESDVAYEAVEEHRTAKMVLQDLEEMESDDVRWKPYLKVLSELILHHVEEEESELFDATRQHFDQEQLDQLAERVQQRKREAMH